VDKDGIEVNPEIEIDYKKDEKHIFVQINIEFDNPNAPFNFNIGIVGSFEFDIDISSENMESVVNINCSALLFPFLSETIADITRRAGFPPLILPPVNFVNLYKKRTQIEAEPKKEL
jgi:preprotein translocase subunit SecB